MRDARATLHESWNVTRRSSLADLSRVSAPQRISSWVTSTTCCGTGVARVEEVEGAGEGVEEAVGDPPGVPAFAEHEPLHPELQRRFPHP